MQTPHPFPAGCPPDPSSSGLMRLARGGPRGGASSNDHQVAIKPRETRARAAGETLCTGSHLSPLAQLEMGFEDSCGGESAAGLGKPSLFQKISKWPYSFPRLINITHVFPPVEGLGWWAGSGTQDDALQSGSAAGRAQGHSWIVLLEVRSSVSGSLPMPGPTRSCCFPC